MKKIKDITLQEVKEGQKWRVHLPSDLNVPVEEWEIEETY